jgi:hypothetical protein
MALSQPSWAIASSPTGEGGWPQKGSGRGGDKGNSDLAKALAGLGKRVDVEDVIKVLLKLPLMNAESIRDLAGAVFLTFQIPADRPLSTRLAATGQSYRDATRGKKPEDHKMGPP